VDSGIEADSVSFAHLGHEQLQFGWFCMIWKIIYQQDSW
jgi:hypothetical protein